MDALTTLQSPQAAQLGQWQNDVVEVLTRQGSDFASLKESTQKEIAGQLGEIAKLRDQVADLKSRSLASFAALAAGGGAGSADTERTRLLGRYVAHAIRPEQAAPAELQSAGVSPVTGAAGGFLVPESLMPGIIRNVEEAGIWEGATSVFPVETEKGSIATRTGGLTMAYPDIAEAPDDSEPTFGRKEFSLVRHSRLTLIDRWLLNGALAVRLGEFIQQELGYALSLTQDTNWFVGDGSPDYAKYVGLLNDSDIGEYSPTADYDTFSEVANTASAELAKFIGATPVWVQRAPDAAFYMHASIYWAYMGLRSSSEGIPLANIYASGEKANFMLMGYPVHFVQVMPQLGGDDDGADKPMMLFGSLQRASRTFRHRTGIELRSSTEYKFREGQIALQMDVLQDRVIVDPNGIYRYVTHS